MVQPAAFPAKKDKNFSQYLPQAKPFCENCGISVDAVSDDEMQKDAYSCSSCGYRGTFYDHIEEQQDNPVGSVR